MVDWRNRAACRDEDPDLFFPLSEWDVNAVTAARAVCSRCPVRAVCLNEALVMGLDHGVFGGRTAAERRALNARTRT